MAAPFWIWLALLIAVPSNGIFIGGEQDVASPLRVAQCRATCLERFSNDGPNGESMCLQGPDCFMCWENCELLQSNFQVWGAMCKEKDICFPGCQEACRFHAEASSRVQQTQPVIHTKGEGVIKVVGPLAKWPRPSSVAASTPLIYVVMRKSQSGPWRQIIQTLDLTTRVPVNSDQAGSTLRVLVVDPQGLVTIYSPDENGLRDARKRKKTINTEIKPTTSRTPSAAAEKWYLREVSLIHQKVLVIGEIAWEPRAPHGVYLVTWEVDGGGLKGNLFTDSTCVTLSLWPDTVYHIQVELVSHSVGGDNPKSEMMDLDTGRAQKVSTESQEELTLVPAPGSESRDDLQLNSPLLSVLVSAVRGEGAARRRHNMELLAGCGAALLLFALLLSVLLWRCRLCQPSGHPLGSHKLVEDFSSYKGFQPIMTVVSAVSTSDKSRQASGGVSGCTGSTPDVAFLGSATGSGGGSAVATSAITSYGMGGGDDGECSALFVQGPGLGGRHEVQV